MMAGILHQWCSTPRIQSMGWKMVEVGFSGYSKKTVVQPIFFNPTIWGWLMHVDATHLSRFWG